MASTTARIMGGDCDHMAWCLLGPLILPRGQGTARAAVRRITS
jgi:hypothetical protein